MSKIQWLVRFGIVLVALAGIATLLPSHLQAQTFFGSVVGTVTDASGAVVPGASVTLTNLGTSESRVEKAGAAGEYRFVNLVPANYKVTAEAPNYKRIVRQPVTVSVDNVTRVDVALEVGAASETVEVTTQAALLQTDSGTLGDQVEGKTVTEMPLNGRNPLNLMALAAGVVAGNNAMGGAAMNNGPGNNSHTTATWNNFIIGGGLGGLNAEYFDGVSMDALGNTAAVVPTQDAVQEFKLSTSSVSAEFGHFSGGVMELTSKSGTNNWHGSAYEYVRNRIFNANFLTNKTNTPITPRPEWNQNQFGVVVGGPVVKDKLFAFFSWEHLVSRLGENQVTNTPSAAMQAGYVGLGTAASPEDLTSNIVVKTLCPQATYQGATGQYAYTTYIPSSCWDKAASVFKGAYPGPNQAGKLPGQNNYVSNPVVGNSQNQYNARVDWAASNKQRLFAHYTYWPLTDTPYDVYNSFGGFKTGNGFTKENSTMSVLGDTYTLNPTTILDFRLGYMRFVYNATPGNGGHIDLTPYGSGWTSLASQMSYDEYPGAHIDGQWNLYDFHPMDDTNFTTNNTYSVMASATKIAGAHTVKAGMELRLLQQTQLGICCLDPSGFFSFGNDVIPDEWAAFLLGYADNTQLHTSSIIGSYQYLQGYYVTDDWAVNRKLTLNLGVRYDLPGGVNESRDKSTVLLPSTKDPNTGVTGTLALVNSSLYASRSTQNSNYKQFQPRIGFAYRVDNNTTVRGGFGLAYTPTNFGGASPTNSPLGSAATSWQNPTLSQFTPTSKYYLFANPFPNGLNQPTGRSNPAFMTNYVNKGQNISGPIPTSPYSYVEQWNLTVGRQLQGNLMVEAAYVGEKGTHLPIAGSWGIDELASTYWSNPSQSQRPFGGVYNNVSNTLANMASSTYHSLQTRVEKRFKTGGLISANYTWAKSISDTSVFGNGEAQPQDYNNPKGERSVVSSNIPNRLVVDYVLNLPFGKGEQFASNVHGVAGAAISGWSVNGITTFQDGFPQALTSNGNTLNHAFGGGTPRPNYTAGCSKMGAGSPFQRYQKQVQTGQGQWFNAACFSAPADMGFGNQVKLDDKMRQQGMDNWDFTASKTTTVHESMNLVFKAEFFNAFNHPQFNAPGTNLQGSRQGGFGQLTGTNAPRLMQLSLRLNY
jgi:hypothetical protein